MRGIEIAFAGRSNVGKSSLINALTGRNALARTSHTPGRTQELIFFAGPAQPARWSTCRATATPPSPRAKVKAWTELIHAFLAGRANLARVYLLIDARHGLKASRRSRADDARQGGGELSARADQGRPGEARRARPIAIAAIAAALAKHPAAYPEVLATSARTGAGMPELRAAIARLSPSGRGNPCPGPASAQRERRAGAWGKATAAGRLKMCNLLRTYCTGSRSRSAVLHEPGTR